jgi:hypothetical protein
LLQFADRKVPAYLEEFDGSRYSVLGPRESLPATSKSETFARRRGRQWTAGQEAERETPLVWWRLSGQDSRIRADGGCRDHAVQPKGAEYSLVLALRHWLSRALRDNRVLWIHAIPRFELGSMNA